MKIYKFKLIILIFAFIIPEMQGTKTNLTEIKWDHAVNSQSKLHHALNSDINMIEADVILGTLINDTNNIILPVMGHPPANKSDISLQTFLQTVLEFNKKNIKNSKGIKLDFKSIEVFENSLDILKSLWNLMNYPIWLNADIHPGPVDNNFTTPVNADRFINGCKNFDGAMLSIGWTTNWGENFTTGSYLDSQINEMIESIYKNSLNTTNHSITFPVRAGIAANSKLELINLLDITSKSNPTTLTVWSSPNDNVNVKKLEDLILSIGVDKVYLDVPEDLYNKLNLGNSSSKLSSLGIIVLILIGFLLENLIMHIFH